MSEIDDTGKSPSAVQLAWLRRGLDQAGGKLPLFDENGQRVDPRTIRACIEHGWAEPWFANPLKPDWLVCKLTVRGRAIANMERRRPFMLAMNKPRQSNVIVLKFNRA
jgi:hypothetical protein